MHWIYFLYRGTQFLREEPTYPKIRKYAFEQYDEKEIDVDVVAYRMNANRWWQWHYKLDKVFRHRVNLKNDS